MHYLHQPYLVRAIDFFAIYFFMCFVYYGCQFFHACSKILMHMMAFCGCRLHDDFQKASDRAAKVKVVERGVSLYWPYYWLYLLRDNKWTA